MSRVQLNMWVEPSARERIKAEAKRRGVSVGALVTEAVLGAVERVSLDERVSGLEDSQGSYERRLSRLEEMAGL